MFVCFIFEQQKNNRNDQYNLALQIIKKEKIIILKNEGLYCTVLFTIQQLKQFLLQKCIGIPENRQWGQIFLKAEFEFIRL